VPRGEEIKYLPKRTHNFLPWKVRSTKKASRLTDQELIRLVGRELLVGAKPPEVLEEWLKAVATEDAITAYRTWTKKILPEAFGARRFVKMDLNAETSTNRRLKMGVAPGETIKEYSEKEVPGSSVEVEVSDPTDVAAEVPAAAAAPVVAEEVVEPHHNS
jgi:hypothetical protein